MEKRQIRIRLKSIQTQAGETQTVEQDLTGTLTVLEGGWSVSKRERESSGLGKTVTTLTAAPGKVVLDRMGETVCRMVFRPGRKTLADYATPYGTFPLEIFTQEVSAKLEENGGEVELVYGLSLSGGEPGETRLTLTFREEDTKEKVE